MKDELLGLADSAEGDQIFRSHGLNMDVLYRAGETHQVDLFLQSNSCCTISVSVALFETSVVC